MGGARSGGDEDLLAVDHVLVAVDLGGGGYRGRVGAEAGFGDGHRGPHVLAEPFQLFVGGHTADGGVAEALAGHGEHQSDVAPTDLDHVDDGRHVAAVVVGFLGILGVAECLGARERDEVRLRDAFEEGGQGIQLDRILVLAEIPFAGYRPEHLGGTLVRLLDHRVQLARQFQIDCHESLPFLGE